MTPEQIAEYNKDLEKLAKLKHAYIDARDELFDEPIVFDKEMEYIRASLERINKTLAILMSEKK